MAWDFTADSEKQEELATNLDQAADNYSQKVEAMYQQIDSMGSNKYWVGEDYDLYKEGTEGYHQALNDLADGLRMYAEHFRLMAGGTEDLATELKQIVNTLTGDTTSASNGGTPGTQTGNNDSNGNENTGTNAGGNPTSTGGWRSYEDAAAAGFSNIRTPSEFARGGDDKEKYGTYQNYLDAMYDKYVNNGTQSGNNGAGGDGTAGANTGGNPTSTGEWHSYEDAAAAGFSNIRTPSEFARGGDDKEKYGTYQNYLDAMYDRYVTNGTQTGNNGAGGNANAGANGGTTTALSSTPVTVSSGQQVTYNGENVYFVMRDSQGKCYYTKSTDATAQVFCTDDNGKLVPYTNYSDKIVSREDFVNDRRYNMDYQWNVTYNNGTSPYDSVSKSVDSSFTNKVSNPSYTSVVYDQNYLKENATTLNNLDRGDIGLGRNSTPEVIYLAPGQSIEYDKPWDTYDNEIKGGAEGKYLVYDSSRDAYFVIREDGTYKTNNDGTFGLWISRDQLLDERTSFNK